MNLDLSVESNEMTLQGLRSSLCRGICYQLCWIIFFQTEISFFEISSIQKRKTESKTCFPLLLDKDHKILYVTLSINEKLFRNQVILWNRIDVIIDLLKKIMFENNFISILANKKIFS